MEYYKKTYGKDKHRHRCDNVGQTPPTLHRDAATNTIPMTLLASGAPAEEESCPVAVPSAAKLRASAAILERVATSNYARRKQMKIMSRAPVAVGPWPEISRLFRWDAPRLGTDDAVTALAWNRDPTLMAVGHGTLHWATSENAFGIVRVWSVKNPLHPEREFFTPAPVSVISFAPHRPAILAIGCRDGLVFMASLVLPDQPLLPVRPFHTAPITSFAWLRFPSKTVHLASAAGDGQILVRPLDPSVSPNRPPHPPMRVQLPRFPPANGSACALATHQDDPDKLLVGTVCGKVFSTQVSRRGPLGGSLKAHHGAVSALERSPFASEIFVSSGADGDMIVWQEAEDFVASDAHLVRRFKCGAYEPVEACIWSPTHATLLVALVGNLVQLWDVRRETPVAVYDTGERCSALAFNSAGDRLLVGAASGHVRLFQVSATRAPRLPRAALLKALALES